jgi:hypothetical protein
MATTHATPAAEPSMPNPRRHPLLALKYVLFGYLPLGGPSWLGVPLDFIPLAHLARYANYFITEGYVSTLMCFLLPLFLLMIDRQLSRKQRAYGGRLFANTFTVADLQQAPANRVVLRRTGTERAGGGASHPGAVCGAVPALGGRVERVPRLWRGLLAGASVHRHSRPVVQGSASPACGAGC